MEPITTSEWIGMAIVAASILILTAQTAYAFGHRFGAATELKKANKRVSNMLADEFAGRARGKSAKSRCKPARKRLAGELVGGVA